jgi:GTP pyrophosphokinase
MHQELLIPFDSLLQRVVGYLPVVDEQALRKAFESADEVHRGRITAWGQPLINSLLEVASLCARLKLDQASVMSGLLYLTVDEDSSEQPLGLAEIKDKFGSDVAGIVEGVGTLNDLEFGQRYDREAESFRMMLLALSRDIRTVLVKLCERLYKLRVAHYLNHDRQVELANEALEVYAPLANRLGIHWLKSELQDYSLLYLRPEVYEYIREGFGATAVLREAYIEGTTLKLQEELKRHGINARVKGRVKHLYSVWQKMERSNLEFDQINDLLGFRVLVDSEQDCYEALGVIHNAWKPVPGRFKDYISLPKSNDYQSLHTTVVGPDGERIEVQIRTEAMNRVAEEGIAAHWRYKEGLVSSPAVDLSWVKELIDNQSYLKQPEEFVRSVKGDLFPEQVIVFTPNGDIRRLRLGSTCLDFAYSIHTDIGNRAIGAKVNGHIEPLGHEIETGDTIEIVTSKNQRPNKGWIDLVRTSKAKQRIKAFLSAEERKRSIELGSDKIDRELKKHDTSIKKIAKDNKFDESVRSLGYGSSDDLYAAVGYGKLAVERVVQRLLPNMTIASKESSQGSTMQRILTSAAKASVNKAGVVVDGLDRVVVRFAKCCTPLMGDPIVGFISRGRYVSVHHADCSVVDQFDPVRLVPVSWHREASPTRRFSFVVTGSQDRVGLLALLTKPITDYGGDIRSAKCTTSREGKILNTFDVVVDNPEKYFKIKRALEKVPGVLKVEKG